MRLAALLLSRWFAFRSDPSGGVAIFFALAIVPLIGAAGAALDYGRASQARTRLQVAADAAAIVGAKGNDSFALRRQAAFATLANQLGPQTPGAYQASVTQVMESGREAGVQVSVQASSPTTLLKVLGISAIPIATDAKASTGRNELVDVAFVLDTTGSMEGARLASLKGATTALIDDFIARRVDADQVRVSLVPFAQYVNVGLANRTQPWIDVPSDYQTPTTQSCRLEREVISQTCTRVHRPAQPAQPRTCYNDGTPYQCGSPAQPAGWEDQCTPVYGPNTVQQCSTGGGDWVRWYGCVGSRAYPEETRDANYAIRIPGLMNVTCASPILEATTDLALAKARINALTTAGETYLPAGLIWGWRALSPQPPLAGRASQAGLSTSRNMVLVTDGMNTRSPTYPEHNGSSTADANAITRTTCENMAADKATGVRLYTIAFEVTDPTVKQLLEQCSTLNGGAFYDAANAAQLQEAMKRIGGEIARVRLTQ